VISRSSSLFWVSIVALLSLTAFYTVSVEREKGKVRESHGTIENGAIAKLSKVVDGDSVILTEEEGKPASVRILGIKSFDSKIEKDVVTPYSQAAVQSLGRLLQDRPIRVMLNGTLKDRYGSTSLRSTWMTRTSAFDWSKRASFSFIRFILFLPCPSISSSRNFPAPVGEAFGLTPRPLCGH
jgi:hypothetical protein